MLHTALEQGYPGLFLLSEATRWDTLAVGISIAVLVLVAAGIMLHQHSRLHELRRREEKDQQTLETYHTSQRAHFLNRKDIVGAYRMNLTRNTCDGQMLDPALYLGDGYSGSVDGFFKKLSFCVHPSDRAEFLSVMSLDSFQRHFTAGELALRGDFLMRLDGKRYVWYRLCIELMENPQNDEIEAVAYALDVNEEKRMEQIAYNLIRNDFLCTALIDPESGRLCLIQDERPARALRAAGRKLFDYQGEIVPDFARIMHAQEFRDLEKVVSLAYIRRKLLQSGEYSVTLRTKPWKGGEDIHYFKLRYTWLGTRRESILFTCENISDIITSRMDAQTGLYNATGLYHRIHEWMRDNPGRRYRLLRYDFDGFKHINASFGYEAGNALLRDFGLFMRGNNTDDSFAAHLTADTFLRFCAEDSMTPEEIYALFCKHYSAYKLDYSLVLHIGVYDLCEEDRDPYIMSYKALLALQTIKGNLTTHIAYYQPGQMDRLQEAQKLLGSVDAALREEQFEVWFQPQYDYQTKAYTGAEALVRWRHPHKGMISPGEFVPLLEHSSLITRVDRFVWEKTCRCLRAWQDAGIAVPVSVNISRMDLCQSDLPKTLTELVRQNGLAPSQLRLEITESAYVDKPDRLIAQVNQFRDAGFSVEMDDFGSGYSSLNMLKEMHVDVLKLDMKFLSAGEDDARSRQILASIIAMAVGLHMDVIAEGVETQRQADALAAIGCRYMQGYYYGKPMPQQEFEALLQVESAKKNPENP